MNKKVSYEISPVAVIHSCFKQKFTIPRQPGLVKNARAELVFLPEFSQEESLRGIENFSHLWIVFIFHQSIRKNKKTTVRPPRLGGKEKRGVFATRSNFRPNSIGQSVVKLESIAKRGKEYVLHLSGVDLLDGTPVIDVKPYIPYADSIPEAKADFASSPPDVKYSVEYTNQAKAQIESDSLRLGQDLFLLIDELLSYDPRPAFYDGEVDKSIFITEIYDRHLRWEIMDGKVVVLEFSPEITKST